MEDSLRSLCARGARMVRLDAYGYATKKKGTRCFFEVHSARGCTHGLHFAWPVLPGSHRFWSGPLLYILDRGL